MTLYRHTCGATEPAEILQPLLDPRWATGRCRCRRPGPWRVVSSEEDARDDGMTIAVVNTMPWQMAATRWVEDRSFGEVITSDDVCLAVGVPPSQGAVGALFSSLAKRGLVASDGITHSGREGRHKSMIRRWVRA